MTSVQEFYDKIQFPGWYTPAQISTHIHEVKNRYLQAIDHALSPGQDIIDIGCGTGLISNLFAMRYPNSNFTGIDFSKSVNYAQEFATTNNILNVSFIKKDFLKFQTKKQYDVVICQGVLHHIPESEIALKKLCDLVKPGGKLVLGLYHPMGKILKKITKINYRNQTLFSDQECNPYETSYTARQVKNMLPGFRFEAAAPSVINMGIGLCAFLNSRNGGLVTYTFEKHD